MNLFVLAFLLLILMMAAYLVHDSDALTPSVLFCLGFFICAAFAMSNASSWNYEASNMVVITIALSVALFVGICWFIHLIMGRSKKSTGGEKGWVLPVSRPALIVFIVLQVIVFFWSLHAISQLYPAGDPLKSISLYDQANKFSDEGATPLPFPLGPLRGLCTAIGYYVCYLVGQSFGRGTDGEEKPLLLANLVVAILVSFESGGRTTAVSYLIYCFIAGLMVRRQWRSTRTSIPFKVFLFALVAFIVIIATFQIALGLMGRSSTTSYWDYICMYVGAEIPNLDYFLSHFHNASHIFGYMTFYTSINWIGDHFGIANFVYQLDLPFRYANGVLMGNVYTTLYAFYYDFGWPGIPVLTAIMAFVSQWVYERASRFDHGHNSCIWVILYMLAANTLIMSFFSNKFFEAFLCIGLLRNLIYISVVHLFYLWVTAALHKEVVSRRCRGTLIRKPNRWPAR